MIQEQPVIQESYTILSLYLPVFCLEYFSTALSLMQPQREQ